MAFRLSPWTYAIASRRVSRAMLSVTWTQKRRRDDKNRRATPAACKGFEALIGTLYGPNSVRQGKSGNEAKTTSLLF